MGAPLVMNRHDVADPVPRSTMFAWPSWETCMNPRGTMYPKMKKLQASDRYAAAGATLEAATHKVGTQLHASTVRQMEAHTGNLTYDSLLKGFMSSGENALTHPLQFKSAEIWDYQQDDKKKTYSQGRCVITSQRLLLMSCEPGTMTKFVQTGAPQKGRAKGRVELNYSASSATTRR